MSKFKICVYAICKNEEKFVDGWVENMSEADEIVVLDTGSTDNTVEKLKSHGVKVYQKKFDTFRFDVARNESMKHISKDMDYCCCIDLDERFEKGWRKVLEDHLEKDVARVSYRYTWSFNEDGSEGIVFFADKIHKNGLFCWEHPVHETLKQIDFSLTKTKCIPTLQLNHHADNSKSRSSYLPLLELSVKEDPTSDRNMHYLGREYFFYEQYDKAIKTLCQHLKMPNSIWDAERSSSCNYIALCYEKLGKIRKSQEYFKRAIAECPTSREPYIEIAKFFFRQKKYLDVITFVLAGLNIAKRELNYMSKPDSWNYLPYDLLALSYYNIKDYKQAVKYGTIALNLCPNDERLAKNLSFYICAEQSNVAGMKRNL